MLHGPLRREEETVTRPRLDRAAHARIGSIVETVESGRADAQHLSAAFVEAVASLGPDDLRRVKYAVKEAALRSQGLSWPFPFVRRRGHVRRFVVPWADLFSPDGFVRQAAQEATDGPAPSPLLFLALMRRCAAAPTM